MIKACRIIPDDLIFNFDSGELGSGDGICELNAIRKSRAGLSPLPAKNRVSITARHNVHGGPESTYGVDSSYEVFTPFSSFGSQL